MTQYLIKQKSDPVRQLVQQVREGTSVDVFEDGELVAVLISAEEYNRIHKPAQNFWESVLEIRKEYGLDGLEGDKPDENDMSDAEYEEIFSNLRDKSPGREVEL